MKQILVLCLALLSQACLVSAFHPVYDNGSIVFDEALIGTWENSDSQVTVAVSRADWRSYSVEYTERTTTTRFTAFLATAGSARVLNVRPADGQDRAAFLVGTNGPLQVMVEGAEVRLRELDYDEVMARLERRSLGIAATTDLRQNVVLTAETPALRRWLVTALRDDRLWAEWKTLTRK